MQIRARLTLWFVLIVALILLGASLGLYYTAANYREKNFYEKMKASGISKTLLLMEFADKEPARLRDLEELSTTFLPREEVFIYNYKNELIYASDPKRRIQISQEKLDEIRINKEIRFEQDGYELSGFMFTDRYNRLVVISGGYDVSGRAGLAFLRNMLWLISLLSLAVVSILAWIYSGSALKPIKSIMWQTESLSVARLSDRLKMPDTPDELGKLTLTINRLLDRIEAAFQMQRQFVANASHELRTPLTALQGQLEVVLMKSRSPEVYQDKLKSLLDDIRQLTVITNQLLLLAQTESAQARENFRPVRMDELLFQCQSAIQRWFNTAQVHIIYDMEADEAEKLTVFGNEELLNTAFNNLIENGLKYSDGKEVTVRLQYQAEKLFVLVEDQGIGIAADQLDKIFQPFFRTESVKGINGNGLGLSLVERIVVMHGGHIQVKSTPGQGSCFTIILPTLI